MALLVQLMMNQPNFFSALVLVLFPILVLTLFFVLVYLCCVILAPIESNNLPYHRKKEEKKNTYRKQKSRLLMHK